MKCSFPLAILAMYSSFAVVLLLAPTAPLFAQQAAVEMPADSLAAAYRNQFLIGAAVVGGEYQLPPLLNYRRTILAEYHLLVAENCMKSEIIHPRNDGRPEDWNWKPADNVVAYARAHNYRLRGHTLLWHNMTAPWMTEGNRQGVRAKLRSHITTLVNRYRKDIYAWDALNEVIADPSERADSIYRLDSPWHIAYGGPGYITDVLDFARQADPRAKLFYNDYNLVELAKRRRAVRMIRELELVRHGLTGVGIQGHWSLEWPSIKEIEQTILAFHEMGLEVQISELDIDCYNGDGSASERPYREFEGVLARRYRELFALFRKHSDKLHAITFWGVADDHTWLDHFWDGKWHADQVRKNYPLLFSQNRARKAAYFLVRDWKE